MSDLRAFYGSDLDAFRGSRLNARGGPRQWFFKGDFGLRFVEQRINLWVRNEVTLVERAHTTANDFKFHNEGMAVALAKMGFEESSTLKWLEPRFISPDNFSGTADDDTMRIHPGWEWLPEDESLLGPHATGLSFNNTSKTITRDSGSWITDGFETGDDAIFATCEDAGNNGTHGPITSLTALVMTIASATFVTNTNDTTATWRPPVSDALDGGGSGGSSDPYWPRASNSNPMLTFGSHSYSFSGNILTFTTHWRDSVLHRNQRDTVQGIAFVTHQIAKDDTGILTPARKALFTTAKVDTITTSAASPGQDSRSYMDVEVDIEIV